MDRHQFEQKVKSYIQRDGRSQAAVARKLGYGVDTFNKWVRGVNRMPDTAIAAFCKLLKLNDQQLAELLTLAGYVAPSTVRVESVMSQAEEKAQELALRSNPLAPPREKLTPLPGRAALLAYVQAVQTRYAQWANAPATLEAAAVNDVAWAPSPYIHLGEQSATPYQLYPSKHEAGAEVYVETYALPIQATRLGSAQPAAQAAAQALLAILEQQPRTLFLGEPGSGKTSALERLAWLTATTTLAHPARNPMTMPLFVRLADYRGEVDLLPLLHRTLNRFEILKIADEGAARQLLWADELHFVLLLDGLNEVKREYLTDALNALRNHSEDFPRHELHLTCRAAGFEQVAQSLPQVKTWMIQPLTDNIRHWYDGQGQSDVRTYLYRHLGDVKGKLLYDRLHSDARLAALARLPLFLWMFKETVAEEGELPVNRGLMLRAFVRSPRVLGSIVDPLLRASAEHGLEMAGWHLQAQGNLSISTGELWQRLVKTPGIHPEDVRAVYEALLRIGLLIGLEDGRVQLLHQLLQEYAAAAWLADQPDFAERLSSLVHEAWQRECVLMALWLGRARHRPAHLLTLMTTPTINLQIRMTAAQILGEIGDPRFRPQQATMARQPRQEILFVEPPLVTIPAGLVRLGEPEFTAQSTQKSGSAQDENSRGADFDYADHRRQPSAQSKSAPLLSAQTNPTSCTAAVIAFALAAFPVTNGEYHCFLKAGGYEMAEFWSEDGRAWLRGEAQLDPISEANHRREHQELCADVEGWLARRQATQALRPEDAETWREIATWSEDRYIEEYVRPIWVKPRRKTAYWHEWHLMQPNQPVVGVNWYEALAYATWLAAITGKPYRLPTEVEWEWAARRNSSCYPWGNDWDADRCNTNESRLQQSTPVGIYPQGATPDGLYDLAGNVNEWTSTLYRPYPYSSATHEDEAANAPRVIRGGSWFEECERARCTTRNWSAPLRKSRYVGFRLAISIQP